MGVCASGLVGRRVGGRESPGLRVSNIHIFQVGQFGLQGNTESEVTNTRLVSHELPTPAEMISVGPTQTPRAQTQTKTVTCKCVCRSVTRLSGTVTLRSSYVSAVSLVLFMFRLHRLFMAETERVPISDSDRKQHLAHSCFSQYKSCPLVPTKLKNASPL